MAEHRHRSVDESCGVDASPRGSNSRSVLKMSGEQPPLPEEDFLTSLSRNVDGSHGQILLD